MIIFDLWKTLAKKNIGISSTLREHFGIEKKEDYIRKYEEAVQLKRFRTMEDLAASYLRAFSIKETEENIDFVCSVFSEGIRKAEAYEGAEDLLSSIKDTKTLLSNTDVFTAGIADRLGLGKHFDHEVFSFDIGKLKPGNLNDVLQRFGEKPEDTVFIDDSEHNIKEAEKLGMKVIKAEPGNIEKIKEDLSDI
ncbi:MAG: HAD family hydrolase [Nanobdellota archaeon]